MQIFLQSLLGIILPLQGLYAFRDGTNTCGSPALYLFFKWNWKFIITITHGRLRHQQLGSFVFGSAWCSILHLGWAMIFVLDALYMPLPGELTNTRFSTSQFQKPRTSRLSEKTAYISRRHHWFPRKMTSEERLQKFSAGDVNYPDLGSASDWLGCEGNLPQPIRQTDNLYFSTMILKAMQRTKYIYIIK